MSNADSGNSDGGSEKAGAVWVIGVSAPAVVTGIYSIDGCMAGSRYRMHCVPLDFFGSPLWLM